MTDKKIPPHGLDDTSRAQFASKFAYCKTLLYSLFVALDELV
jgi:hypothetical protein